MADPTISSELRVDAATAAKRLLGAELISTIDGKKVSAIIVETEAYDQTDAASHSYRGQTERTKVMFGPSGFLYVYFTYGMHYCANIVVGQAGEGAAVLIRAVEPQSGWDYIKERRGGKPDHELTNGPAKTCQALGINKSNYGHDLSKAPIRLKLHPPVEAQNVVTTTRIGISEAKDVPWRFYIKDNPYVSKTV